MDKNYKQMPEASNERIPLKFVVEGKEYQTCNQYITGAELKQIAGIPSDTELFLSISKPYEDELIENEKTVNLARPETEYFFVKKKLHFTINDTPYTWYKQYIRGIQIRQLGNIPAEDEIYLDLPEGWKDDFITDDEIVDLARPGVEKFISKFVRVSLEGLSAYSLLSLENEIKNYLDKVNACPVASRWKVDPLELADFVDDKD